MQPRTAKGGVQRRDTSGVELLVDGVGDALLDEAEKPVSPGESGSVQSKEMA